MISADGDRNRILSSWNLKILNFLGVDFLGFLGFLEFLDFLDFLTLGTWTGRNFCDRFFLGIVRSEFLGVYFFDFLDFIREGKDFSPWRTGKNCTGT